MSVLVKGMKMPESCYGCDLANFFTDETPYCRRRMKAVSFSGDRPSWCPLQEVPEPHGRLIDADALIATHKQVCSRSMKFNLDLAPTIIPASEEEKT